MDIARDLFFSHQTLAMLFSVTNKLQMKGDKYLGDLTIRQMLALPAVIHAPEGKATINYIAKQLGTTKQNAKQIVSALEKKNYVSVAPNESDKRAVSITVTPESEEAYRQCSQRTDMFIADIFSDFSTEDLETLWTLLNKLYSFDGSEAYSTFELVGSHTKEDMSAHHHDYVKRRTDRYE